MVNMNAKKGAKRNATRARTAKWRRQNIMDECHGVVRLGRYGML